MIHVATNPAYHLVFDAAAWAGGMAAGVALYRWRLAERRRGWRGWPMRVFRLPGRGRDRGGISERVVHILGTGRVRAGAFGAGALVGAIAGVEIYKAARGIRMSTGIVFVGPFAAGVAIGRWGCLFAGPADQTFGIVSSLPWAVELGDGIARHPVQIYEATAMAAFFIAFVFGLRARARWATAHGFYWLAIAYGAQRFVWEFLKPYPGLIGPFNHFHLMCAGLAVYGA
jgi:hypothetical protein